MKLLAPIARKLRDFRHFGARVWALSAPYFRSEDKWKARALLAAIVALNLAAVYMLVLLNDWNRVFYDALQNKDAAVFWTQLGRFTYLAFAFIIIAVYRFYLTQLLEMRWRAWMTTHYLQRWLSGQAFYRLELARFTGQRNGQGAEFQNSPDNPDQRIQEDINLFTSYSISLSMGLLNAVVTLVSFVGILWSLSGAFAFSFNGASYSIPGFMVWMAVLYCALGSVATHYIGRPQIRLNFQQQQVEADFRHHMVRVREYSESIALDKGEAVERAHLDTRFAAVLANYLTLIKKQKNLVWFTNFFGQAAVVFPFVVAAPRFFSGAIQLGELMQIASAFGRVQDSLSWLVDNYSSLAAWRATTDRLTSFEDNISAVAQQQQAQSKLNASTSHALGARAGIAPGTEVEMTPGINPHPAPRTAGMAPTSATANTATDTAPDTLTTSSLSVKLPTGVTLLENLSLQASPGQSVLLKGPSGSGKSTLFRSLAGIWPFASGPVHLPQDAMFIPQRPYFPDGSLRDALAYPQPAADYSDAALQQALQDALLPGLAARLDEKNAWTQKLSGGEQQRLAIARVLLKKPHWIFADEATSALDEAAEQTLYARLLAQTRQAGGALVSIAHRPSVAAFHDQLWALEKRPDGAGALYQLSEKSSASVAA